VQDPVVAILAQRARRLGLIRTRTILAHGTEEPFAFQRKITFLQHLAPWHLEEARRAGVVRRHWSAIPNFADINRFAPGSDGGVRDELGIPGDAHVVLCVAAIKRDHKRIDYLIDEFARLRSERPGLKAYLVIAGGWETQTDDLITDGQRRLGDRVRFLIRYPRSKIPDLYRAADLFVLPSLKEMMPVALLEAIASALPCLVHRHPVLEWMIGPGGKVIDMALPGELAAALARWLTNPAECSTIGRAARDHCIREFSANVVVDRILDYYRHVVAVKSEGVAA
jgi:glycosyltransferase involved in cell wall biosynthesis